MRRWPALALLVALAAGCGGGTGDDPYAYDADQPLAIERGSRVPSDDGVVVRELGYASGDDRVEAYLVVPRGPSTRLPGVVFLHGAGGDRSEQLGFATELAEHGAVTLTITVPSRRKAPPTGVPPSDALRWQRDSVIEDVTAARRGFDVLVDDDRVDAERLALVGWSMGARLAAIVADVDDRATATVLMSGGALPVEEYVDAAPVQLRDDVAEVLRAVDPLAHLPGARGAVFVQAGRLDAIVPRRALSALADAAPKGSRVTWYDADHALDEQASDDRLSWLSDRLGIGR
jgi:dienelactone hydrolase